MTTKNTPTTDVVTPDRHIIVWSAEAANIEVNKSIHIDDVDNDEVSISDVVYDTVENEYLNVVQSQEFSDTVIDISVKPLMVPELINWFAEHSKSPALHPHKAYSSDSWVVEENGEIIAIALVDEECLERITVRSHQHDERIKKDLLSILFDEYDNINTS